VLRVDRSDTWSEDTSSPISSDGENTDDLPDSMISGVRD
jgi:hypothetical protein